MSSTAGTMCQENTDARSRHPGPGQLVRPGGEPARGEHRDAEQAVGAVPVPAGQSATSQENPSVRNPNELETEVS